MDKNKYIEQETLKLIKFWSSFALIAGALIIILLSILDYFVTPDNFSQFLFYRLTCAFLMAILYLINKQTKGKYFQYAIIILAGILTSATVEIMILSFGGYQSTYYAGIMITTIFILGVIPIPFILSLVVVFVAYAIYLFPILLLDNITNLQIFINNNSFLLATFTIALIWRLLSQKSLNNELSLQYELDKDKRELETYSTQLEQLVQERTKELTISEKWHRSIFDNATEGVMVLDKNGMIINVNKKACEIHGFDKDALMGVNIELLEVKGDREDNKERMSRILNGESLIYEIEHYRKDGDKILLEVSSKGIDIEGETYIQSFSRDITEKKKIQAQLMHSQKMDSVGALAGGIAHNFNNILTAILGNAELLQEYSDLDDTSKQRVRNIESSARKAGVMVSKLLSFSRRETHEVVPLNLHDLINDAVRLFEGVLDKKIGIKMELCNAVPIIEGDPNQLEQVIMNLMVNARDAMPDGGLITITTHAIEVKRDRFDLPDYIVPGNYVVLTISDTGYGIPEELINKIFDPFFTTKEKGKGTGLGLAMVYGIIKDHKGYISVRTVIDKGSSFDIYLPVSGKITQKSLKPYLFSVEGNENILVVDDDKDVLNFIKEILETHGYTVLPANNSLTAVDTFKNLSSKIQLVITDVMMPLMEGNELIKILKTIKPGIKIIAVSGYSSEGINKENMEIDVFIKKPFQGSDMLSTVRRLLDTGIRKSPLY